MNHTKPITLCAAILLAGAAIPAGIPVPAPLAATEETAAERIERLLPDLLGGSAEARERAERQVFALGAAGRAELERLSRDADPAKSQLANRLLGSKSWDAVRPGEERIRREGDPAPADDGVSLEEHLRRLRAQTESQLAEFDRKVQELRKSMSERIAPDAPGLSQKGEWTDGRSRFQWEIGADGRVRVTTKDAGAEEKTYEAESIAKLREAHPDIAKRLEERTGSVRVRGPGIAWPELPPLPDMPAWKDLHEHFPDLIRRLERDADGRFRLRAEDPAPEDATGPRLGITVQSVPDVLREHVDVPALRDAGLVVEEVAAGSLAAALGLRRNDVLLRVGTHTIRTASDVRAALVATEAEPRVTVEVLRKGRVETLSTAKPEAARPK